MGGSRRTTDMSLTTNKKGGNEGMKAKLWREWRREKVKEGEWELQGTIFLPRYPFTEIVCRSNPEAQTYICTCISPKHIVPWQLVNSRYSFLFSSSCLKGWQFLLDALTPDDKSYRLSVCLDFDIGWHLWLSQQVSQQLFHGLSCSDSHVGLRV